MPNPGPTSFRKRSMGGKKRALTGPGLDPIKKGRSLQGLKRSTIPVKDDAKWEETLLSSRTGKKVEG